VHHIMRQTSPVIITYTDIDNQALVPLNSIIRALSSSYMRPVSLPSVVPVLPPSYPSCQHHAHISQGRVCLVSVVYILPASCLCLHRRACLATVMPASYGCCQRRTYLASVLCVFPASSVRCQSRTCMPHFAGVIRILPALCPSYQRRTYITSAVPVLPTSYGRCQCRTCTASVLCILSESCACGQCRACVVSIVCIEHVVCLIRHPCFIVCGCG
jgi:hypothetical protein